MSIPKGSFTLLFSQCIVAFLKPALAPENSLTLHIAFQCIYGGPRQANKQQKRNVKMQGEFKNVNGPKH